MTLIPRTQREQQIVSVFGANGWEILDTRPVVCFNMQIGILIRKNNHIRWVREGQVK